MNLVTDTLYVADPERDTEVPLNYRNPTSVEELREMVTRSPKLVRLFLALPDPESSLAAFEKLESSLAYTGPLLEAPDVCFVFLFPSGEIATLTKKGQLFRVS